MAFFLQWFSPVCIGAFFVLIGWFGIRKKIIPLRLALDSVIGFYVIALIDFFVRVLMMVKEAYPNSAPTLESLSAKALIITAGDRVISRLVYVTVVAVSVWLLLALIAHKNNDKYLDHADALVLAFGILVSGWADFIIYFFLIFACATLWMLLLFLFKRRALYERMPITPFFVIAGIAMLIWGNQLSQLTGLYVLR